MYCKKTKRLCFVHRFLFTGLHPLKGKCLPFNHVQWQVGHSVLWKLMLQDGPHAPAISSLLTDSILFDSFLRLFGNCRSSNLWPESVQTRQDPPVPAADEGAYLCTRLHRGRHHIWCLHNGSETQTVRMKKMLNNVQLASSSVKC